MGKTKEGARYQSVSLAIPFIEEIKKHIKDRPEYRSVADFVREAVRQKMQLEKINNNIWNAINITDGVVDYLNNTIYKQLGELPPLKDFKNKK